MTETPTGSEGRGLTAWKERNEGRSSFKVPFSQSKMQWTNFHVNFPSDSGDGCLNILAKIKLLCGQKMHSRESDV